MIMNQRFLTWSNHLYILFLRKKQTKKVHRGNWQTDLSILGENTIKLQMLMRLIARSNSADCFICTRFTLRSCELGSCANPRSIPSCALAWIKKRTCWYLVSYFLCKVSFVCTHCIFYKFLWTTILEVQTAPVMTLNVCVEMKSHFLFSSRTLCRLLTPSCG